MNGNESKHEANKLVRVLSGKPLKYTVRLHRADGSVVELQASSRPTVKWLDDSRSMWVHATAAEYETYPVMPYEDGMVILCEENPKP